jgi:hypothetical protein
MMNPLLRFQDWYCLLIVPIMVVTIIELAKNWQSVWDNQVTKKDREILMKTAMFLLLPIAVFFHELGHAWATLQFGGTIKEFHYGILWGYVIPDGDFSLLQLLIIYLAGNIVELVIGILALIASCLVTSAPFIILLTYFGLWCVGGTIILYPALSFTGMYGDWIAIYSIPLKQWTNMILIVHISLVSLLLVGIYNKSVKGWYASRTGPEAGQ